MKQFRDTPYYVTEDGKVFRHYPDRYVKNGKIPKTREQRYLFKPEMWVKVGALDRDGYEIVDVCINNKKQGFKSHRMVAESYVSGYFDGAHVDHIDGNRINNQIAILNSDDVLDYIVNDKEQFLQFRELFRGLKPNFFRKLFIKKNDIDKETLKNYLKSILKQLLF